MAGAAFSFTEAQGNKVVSRERLLRTAGVAIPLLYLVVSFLIIDDYGITWDEPADFGIGHKYLYFFQTGHLDLQDDLPRIPGHPDFYVGTVRNGGECIHWPLANILSAITCDIFYQKLGILDPIPAHHIVIPILVTVLGLSLFFFVSKNISPAAGLVSVLGLLSYPRFFGHTFNNVKDVPEVVFFSLTIMLFAQWTISRRARWLLLAFVAWACALTTKVDAVMIPPMLMLWQLPYLYSCIADDGKVALRTVLIFVAGFLFAGAAYVLLFVPLSPFSSYSGKTVFLYSHIVYVTTRGIDLTSSWNLYSEYMVGIVTPTVMLGFFVVGFYWAVRNSGNSLSLLLLIWLLVPIVRHSLPHVGHYDGIRLFMTFLIPFAIITSIAVVRVSEQVAKRLRAVLDSWVTVGVAALAIAPNAWAIISSHPYQTTFFNAFVGGLGGAQERGIGQARDYWLNSYKAAGAWLDEHAAAGAHYHAMPNTQVLTYSVTRPDLKPLTDDVLSELPGNTYVVVTPRRGRRSYWQLMKMLENTPVVYELKRDGGEMFTIYHKPRAEAPAAGATVRGGG